MKADKPDKEIRSIDQLKNWDKNPRGIKTVDFERLKRQIQRNDGGQFIKGIIPLNKGMGMSREQKKEARKLTLKRYNNKPERKLKVNLWHSAHPRRVKEIKQKYAWSARGKMVRRECGQRRIARERKLSKPINMNYFWWMCNRLNYRCLGCGKQCDRDTITIDHQLPINRGGDNDNWNLIPLCKFCNSRKQDRLFFVDNILADLVYGEWLYEHEN